MSEVSSAAAPKYPLTPSVLRALEITKRGCDELLV